MYIIERRKAATDTAPESKPTPVRDRYGVVYFDKSKDAHRICEEKNNREADPRTYYTVKFVC